MANIIYIYGIDDKPVLTFDGINLDIDGSPEHEEEMMKSNFVKLSWNDTNKQILSAGIYIIYQKVKYRLLDPYIPKQNNECEFRYEPEFQHPVMWLDRIPFWHITGDTTSWETATKESDWSYTGNANTILTRFLEILNKWLPYIDNVVGDEFGKGWTLEMTNNIKSSATCTFSNMSFLGALSECATNFECQYHLDWKHKVLFFGLLSEKKDLYQDEPTVLKGGDNVSTPDITETKEKYYNCFRILGSTRNLSQPTNSGYEQVYKRLTLDETEYPDSIIDIRKNKEDEPKFFKELVFDNIYPKIDLYCYNIRERRLYLLDDEGNRVKNDDGTDKQWSIWYMRLAYKQDDVWKDYVIDPKKDIISGKTLSVQFQPNFDSTLDSPLSGREFELTYHDKTETVKNKDDVSEHGFTVLAGDYEIVHVEENGIIIPTTRELGLYPRSNGTNLWNVSTNDNKATLYNIVISDAYIKTARQELLDTAMLKISHLQDDKNNYTVNSNPVVFEEAQDEMSSKHELSQLYVGQNIIYDDGQDLNGGISNIIDTHIIKIVTKIDFPFEQEITLGNETVQGTISSLKDDVQTIISGFSNGAIGVSFTEQQVAQLIANYGDRRYISKKRNDAAQGLIRFLQGLRVGNGDYGLDDRGDALLRNVVTGGEQRSADYDAAGQTGYGIVRRTDGKYGLHITDLEVWGRATFSELEVRKLTYAGGNFVFSPAGGTMAHVEELRDGDEISGWRCYFLADDGTTETSNMWHAGDQALCETSNVESGVSYAAGNKRYWRRVSGVSAENVQIYGPDGNAMYDGHKFAWIDLMASDCEEDSDIPAAGDTVCCMGNRTETTRQNAIVIYTTGDIAPAFIEYQGIDSYSLEGRDKTVISPVTGSKFRGKSFEIETGGGSVRVPADRGEWQQGVAYYNYDRVSHGGNLWLCTVAEGQSTDEEPAAGAEHWTAQTKTGDGALGISGDGQEVVVPADHAGHPQYCERRIVMSLRLGQKPVVISSAELGVDTSRIQDLGDFLWVDDVYDGTVEILLQYRDTINEQSLDMLVEQGDIPVEIGYREDFGAADEKTVTAHFHLVKVKDGADGAQGEKGDKGDKGDDGKDAWQVAVTPQVLAIESSAAGTVGAGELTGARAVVSVRRGQRDIGVREIRNIRTEHCAAKVTADGAIRITKVDDYELEGRRFAYGSGWIMAEVVSETDSSDGASVTQDVRVDFTVSVTAQTAQLKVEQDGIEARVEEISNKTGTLETSVSEIRQTAESISLKVDRTAVSGRNLIPCSYLRMVTSTYGVALRKVRIYGGRDYTLSVNGHIDSVLKGDGRRLAAFVWIAGEDGVWTWSASAHIDSLEDVTASVTFSLPEDMTGLHEVNTGCFPLMDGGPQYEGTGMMTVNWMQLEEGTVATPWSPSAEDMAAQGNLLPGIDSMVVPQGGASEATEVRLEAGGYTDGSGQVLDVVYGRNGNAAGGSVLDTCVFTGLTVDSDMTYTLSFWARGTGHAVSHMWKDGKSVTAASYAGDGTIRVVGDGYCVTEITAEWRRYMLTWTTRRTGGGDAGVIPLRLTPGSEAWICGIKLEMYGRATEYTLKGVTEKELLATGIDIRHRKITLTADMLEVRNNSGDVTAEVNEDGVLETTDGIFKGTVRADAGYFNNGTFDKGTFMKGVFTDADVTGVIRAIRGNIGNWVFIDKYMGSGTVELNEDGTYKIVTDESQGMNLRDNYIEFINKGNLGGPVFGTDPGSASSPTGLNMSQKAALGAMTMGGTAAIPVLCQLLDTRTYPTDKIGIYFDIRNSTNGRNLAFCGNGNGYLDGFIDGIGYQKETLSTANMRLIISEVRSNRIIVNCTASNCSIALPKLSVMQRILGTGASTPFTFRLMMSADIHSAAFRVEGRNQSINNDDYPLIVRSKNRLSDNFAVNACDALEFILVYDPERTDDISGYTTKYTARVINTYSEV